MEKNLVIVESPAKAKTIEKFLGKGYKVLPSYGHIRDLRTKDFSIDIEHGFAPQYEIPADKAEVVERLRAEARKAGTVWLASDEDREGEAIAWHLSEVLELDPEHTRRIVFHEITRPAILQAIEQPRAVDLHMVDAQQARRVLDRIVGFELSPVLWRKVKPSLSAGRVQSVALRLVVEREREIQAFVPDVSYRITATLLAPPTDGTGTPTPLRAELSRRFRTEAQAQTLLEACRQATLTVTDVVTRPLHRAPAPPFTTSTLQQEAARRLGMTVSMTMRVAQHLYESGLITYMRTDSVNLSKLAINDCRETITRLMGPRYSRPRQYVTRSKGAQEAHEAIRPTHLDRPEIEGNASEKRLYNLIWRRTIASQMADAELRRTTVTIAIGGQSDTFVATGEVINFDGYLRVVRDMPADDAHEPSNSSPTASGEQAGAGLLPPLSPGQVLERSIITATERHTQHPPRYNEATLVRRLEELGIGRPSTYAPTISTIQQREYVVRGDLPGTTRTYTVITLEGDRISRSTPTETVGADRGKLLPTDVGLVVTDYLTQHFPSILDYGFTAGIEQELDAVAEGNTPWTGVLASFYNNFHPLVEAALNDRSEHRAGERVLGTDPVTGRPVSVKIGRYGPLAQVGTASDDEKPRFARLAPGMSIASVTLEQVLPLFSLPRKLGELEGEAVTVAEGRFGPYVRRGGIFASLPKGSDPLSLTYDEAIQLIQAKREAEAQRHLKAFAQEPDLEILQGRWGPYITYRGSNYRIPRGTDPLTLTLDDCMRLINEQGIKEPRTKRTARTAAKSPSKAKATETKTASKAKAPTATKDAARTKTTARTKTPVKAKVTKVKADAKTSTKTKDVVASKTTKIKGQSE